MEFLADFLNGNEMRILNYMGLIIGIICFLYPLKLQKIWIFFPYIYVGFIVGNIVGIVVTENIQGAIIGSLSGAVISIIISYLYKNGALFIVSSFVVSKICYVFLLLFIEEFSLYLFCSVAFFSAILGYVFIRLIDEKNVNKDFIYKIFGVFELSGCFVAIFSYNTMSIDKFLYGREGYVYFFLYLLKVDFTICDKQILFIFLIFLFWGIRLFWRKMYTK